MTIALHTGPIVIPGRAPTTTTPSAPSLGYAAIEDLVPVTHLPEWAMRVAERVECFRNGHRPGRLTLMGDQKRHCLTCGRTIHHV